MESFERLVDIVERRVIAWSMRPWIRRGMRARRLAAEAARIPAHASWDVERQAKINTAAYQAHEQQSRAYLIANTPADQAWAAKGAWNANAGNQLEALAGRSYEAQVLAQNLRAAIQGPYDQTDQLRPPGSDTYHDAKRYGLTWGDDD